MKLKSLFIVIAIVMFVSSQAFAVEKEEKLARTELNETNTKGAGHTMGNVGKGLEGFFNMLNPANWFQEAEE